MTKEMENQIKEIEGLYLKRDLQGLSKKAGRMVIIANYVTDINDVIARKDESGEFQVATELKNNPDWRLFQELTAQADIIITGAGYLKRFAAKGEGAENVIDQFSSGGQFENLGNWRLEQGFKKRNPDIAIVSRSLDFDIPKAVFGDGRRVIVFTTYEGTISPKAKEFKNMGVFVIGSGVDGVDGKIMADFLASGKVGEKYNVVKMTTGPRVLKILLDANVLDELYITQVQREIEADAKDIQTVLRGTKISDLPGFKVSELYTLTGVETADGHTVTEKFIVYDNEVFLRKLGS
jgi:riboflavin biosynthesis pyrimidine reductase